MSPLVPTGRSLLTTSSFNRRILISTTQRSFLSYFTSTFGGGTSDDGKDNKDNKNSRSSSNETISGVFSKGDMIKMVAEEYDLSHAQSGRIINSIFDTIMEEVSTNKKVSISGFGTFQGIDRKERNGVNPSNGEKIIIPATRRVKFSVYKSFKDLVAQSK